MQQCTGAYCLLRYHSVKYAAQIPASSFLFFFLCVRVIWSLTQPSRPAIHLANHANHGRTPSVTIRA